MDSEYKTIKCLGKGGFDEVFLVIKDNNYSSLKKKKK